MTELSRIQRCLTEQRMSHNREVAPVERRSGAGRRAHLALSSLRYAEGPEGGGKTSQRYGRPAQPSRDNTSDMRTIRRLIGLVWGGGVVVYGFTHPIYASAYGVGQLIAIVIAAWVCLRCGRRLLQG